MHDLPSFESRIPLPVLPGSTQHVISRFTDLLYFHS